MSQKSDASPDPAAEASRLPSHTMTPLESVLFRSQNPANVVKFRNAILRQWLANPTRPCCVDDVLRAEFGVHFDDKERDKKMVSLLYGIYAYLVRYGYVDHGLLATDTPTTHVIGSDPNRPRVVVVGAGIAGLALARQLTRFSSRQGLLMDVITVEGRLRIGGRVNSISLPATNDNVARVDLGAQIITGFGNGNPLDTLLRHQLYAPLVFFGSECPLYDSSGLEVDAKTDALAEQVYNDILERACMDEVSAVAPVDVDMPRQLVRQSPGGALLEPLSSPSVASTNASAESKRASVVGRRSSSISSSSTVPNWDPQSLGHALEHALLLHERFPKLKPPQLSLIHWHLANLEFANASRLDLIDRTQWNQDDDFAFEGNHAIMYGGYSKLADALSNHFLDTPGLELDIHFDKQVTECDWTTERPQLTFSDDTVIDGDLIAITVPLG
jgi:lysine-specific histone demethylase 1